MATEDSKLLQAYVDGELDPVKTLEFEARLAANRELRSSYERLRDLSGAIREKADSHAAPAALTARLRGALDRQPRPGPRAAPAQRLAAWLAEWMKPMVAAAAALVVGLGVGISQFSMSDADVLTREVLASHVRATLSDRLIDVASSDQHTVKPWLSARLPYSPPVTDFSGEGFTLTGARLEYIGSQPVAVLVYKRRLHTIDLFTWPAGSVPALRAEKSGFNIERFSAGGLQYWAVSDVNRKELEDFARLVAGRS